MLLLLLLPSLLLLPLLLLLMLPVLLLARGIPLAVSAAYWPEVRPSAEMTEPQLHQTHHLLVSLSGICHSILLDHLGTTQCCEIGD